MLAFAQRLNILTCRAKFVNTFFKKLEKFFLILVIEHAVAVAGEIGISHLLPEFLADALVILGALHTAGTIAAGTLQAVPNDLHHFLIFIKTYCHSQHFLPFFISITWMSTEKDPHPRVWIFFGGELGIRTLGSFRNH